MKQGRLLELGSREEVFLRPKTGSVAEIVGIENRLPGSVESLDGDYAEISINGAKIHATGEFKIGARVVVCVRADDVSLNPVRCETKSRNLFGGTIVDVSAGITQQHLLVDCGCFRLVALIARKHPCHRILSSGEYVSVTVSPSAVHPIRITEQ